MGGAFAWVVLALASHLAAEAAEPPSTDYALVDFSPGHDPDVLARELCLRFGCTIRHVYRGLPGMAIVGGRRSALERADGVSRVTSDPEVHFQPNSAQLIGAPGWAPMAVIGAGLDSDRVIVEKTARFTSGEAGRKAADETTDLVAPLVERQPERKFWSLTVVGPDGTGRLSDVLAALDYILTYRFAVSVVYMPMVLSAQPAPRLCVMIDQVLRHGLLVVTDIDRNCPIVSAYP